MASHAPGGQQCRSAFTLAWVERIDKARYGDAVSTRLPSTVPEAVERLRALETSRTDGVACFARLYREVTEGVAAELAGQRFADAAFLEMLDVRFAGLFFTALDAYERDPRGAPRAWAPLFAQRARRGIAPLQFALAGMNAHINRDLPVALVTTCGALSIDFRDPSPEHDDYLRVNAILARVEARVKRLYLGGVAGFLDRLVHRVHRLDDVIAMWDVERARDAAWINGLALWHLRADRELGDAFLATLDRSVGLASRGLLVPADTVLRRLRRRFG
jgi:hypothetical protein